MTPTPLEMLQEVASRHADGSRELTIDRPGKELRVCKSSTMLFDCWSATVAVSLGNQEEPPAYCQRVIASGTYFITYQPTHPGTGTPGRKYRYCAPCAVREWILRGVREATP